MQEIIRFFEKRLLLLTYLFLLSVGILLIKNTRSGSAFRFFALQSALGGHVMKIKQEIKDYFFLKENNKRLIEENLRLRRKMQNLPPADGTVKNFRYIPAHLISHYHEAGKDFVIIDKGKHDNIQINAGAFTPEGVLGIIGKTSAHFSKILTLKNREISLAVKPLHQNYTGFTAWNDLRDLLLLQDYPPESPLSVGDTLVTAGNSLIFPPGIPVAKVQRIFMNKGVKTIVLKTFTDEKRIGTIYLSIHPLQKELDSIVNEKY